ncbi:helix-turn-helix domain-containing protein [Halobacterium litoreum]|uniref:Helix-turn-helix domain-containing protein n=1 Tax=Halobacterium litoreum TaxID=2039234 RepID=A0ABD5NE69_9EURY|nr:helix-turn-helix domain-containing protein [Halobacterium litoreum]UHH13947.1 helix-turn-helix domain-containing protein [Halobacterium litoreum]
MSRGTSATGTRLTLDLWHPDCWAIQATEDNPGGILAHAVYDSPTSGECSVNSLFTAYGETESEVEALLDSIDESPLTETVRELHTQLDTRTDPVAPGEVSREFFLEHDPTDMICPLLLEHGFVHSSPGRIEGGREYWNVRYAGERGDIEDELASIEKQANADIDIERIGSVGRETRDANRLDALTPSQREAFELARERGYYEWPREASTRELASELDVSKTTLLEHLRKAEAKLLDP